jgi:hypothetical protein
MIMKKILIFGIIAATFSANADELVKEGLGSE